MASETEEAGAIRAGVAAPGRGESAETTAWHRAAKTKQSAALEIAWGVVMGRQRVAHRWKTSKRNC
jgi:hypothetical protein